MKNIKSFLKNIDGFGIPYLFRYKTKKNYTSSLGGLIIIIFYILLISFIIYYFIPFIRKKNFTSIYYTSNILNAKPINLSKEQLSFSFGLTCENNNEINLNNLLEIESKFISNENKEGNHRKKTNIISTHHCTYSDFNNKNNQAFDNLKLSNYKCLDNNNNIIEGIYSDEIYSYYELNLKPKLNSPENINNINSLLKNNECSLQIIYTDINIDLNNYKNPINTILNSLSIELVPDILIIQDIFFMNQYYINDDHIFGVFNEDKSNKEIYTTLSRYEKYSLNKDNSNIYAKIFLKADNRKAYIKRKYQKFIEFFADISSIFISIYSLLKIIFSYINNFYSELSLSKNIFLFKDINDKKIDFSKKVLNIQQLISLTNQSVPEKINKEQSEKVSSNRTNVTSRKNNKEDLDIDDMEINRIKNEILDNYYKSDNRSNITNVDKGVRIYKKNKKNKANLNRNNNLNFNISKNFSFNSGYKFNSGEIHKNNIKKKESKTCEISSSSGYNNYICNKDINFNSSERSSETRREYNIASLKKNKIDYNFNLIEIINILLFNRCTSNDLKTKNDLNTKANNILYNKLDIVAYIRNMFVFDIINQMVLDENKKYIINFLCRPIISNKEIKENEFQEFYKKYDETEFTKSTLGIYKLLRIDKNKNSEQKLITLSNEQLKELL